MSPGSFAKGQVPQTNSKSEDGSAQLYPSQISKVVYSENDLVVPQSKGSENDFLVDESFGVFEFFQKSHLRPLGILT